MTARTPQERREAIAEELRKCRGDPSRFNSVILGRDADDGHGNRGYWGRQREIARSFVDYPSTYVPTGNMVGKSFVDSGLILEFLVQHPNCLVVATAPSQTQLEEVLWKEVERAYRGSRIPLGGRLLRSPLKVDFGGGWQALAYSTTKVERFSGHHGKDVGAILDEASGVVEPIWEAVDSLNPSRLLGTGNPLWNHGQFYERCSRGSNELANVIRVSSLESPHIHLPRSPWGLADRTWLAKSRNDYGEAAVWWTTHVLGRFPDSGIENVIPTAWLELAGKTIHRPAGPRRLAIDLGEGKGGDPSVIGVKDDNGILHWDVSYTWNFETTATRAALCCQRFGIEGHNVSWDVGGIGSDFSNRLEAAGIHGARPYRGGSECGAEGRKKFFNRRAMCAWRLRQRLDPNRQVILDSGVAIPQQPFSIRPDILAKIRQELAGILYENDEKGRIKLEEKQVWAKRLKHSPNHADTATQLFNAA
jgi:phage terminase large subunit